MAHAARLSTLTDELVQSLTGLDPKENARDFKKAKDIATRELKSTQYSRTNQFDIQEKFEGLQEKFFILNRADLADAVGLRLQKLRTRDFKWTPETLSLLLQLSDQPVINVDPDGLEHLQPEEAEQSLTWEEIFGNNEEDVEGIWDDVDFAAESSGDDEAPEIGTRRQQKPKVKVTVASLEDGPSTVDAQLVAVDSKSVERLRKAQFWKRRPTRTEEEDDSDSGIEADPKEPKLVTELQAIREVLFMLAGLPTSLFTIHERDGAVRCKVDFVLNHTSPLQFQLLLEDYCAIGGTILRLRRWIDGEPTTTLLQSFQNQVEVKLHEYDMEVSQIHQQYITPATGAVVSLQEMLPRVQKLSMTLRRLSEVVKEVTATDNPVAYTYLEKLFDSTSLAQLTGEDDTYEDLGGIFFACFRNYLRPIREWMEKGHLARDQENFFVEYADASCDRSVLWHERFRLRSNPAGQLHAPAFLHPKTKGIFNTGKSVVFLRELGHTAQISPETLQEPDLDFRTVCQKFAVSGIEPFANLFDVAFDEWILSKHNLAADMLRTNLLEELGLHRHIHALEVLFLSKDGALFQTFADSIFEKIDSKSNAWNDRFVLTDTAQRVFGLDTWRIFVQTTGKPKGRNRTVKDLATVQLNYTLPWALLNVIKPSFITVYQQIASLIMQCYRAKYVLQRCSTPSHTRRTEREAQLAIYLRHRLIWFADSLRSYLTLSALPEHSRKLHRSLADAVDIDTMTEVCEASSKKLQEQCLLSKNLAPLTQSVVSILDIAVLVHDTLMSDPREAGRHDNSKSESKLRRTGHVKRGDASSTDEEMSSDDGYSGDDEDVPAAEGSKLRNLERAKEQFDRLCPFVVSGLKSVARSRGEEQWQILAHKLDWESKGEDD